MCVGVCDVVCDGGVGGGEDSGKVVLVVAVW